MNKNNEVPEMYMPHAVFAYVHHNKRVAAMVTLKCKTDFALRTDVLQTLGQRLTMQIAASLQLDLESNWMFDSSKKVKDVIKDTSDELGEPVIVYQVSVHGNNVVLSEEFLDRVKAGAH